MIQTIVATETYGVETTNIVIVLDVADGVDVESAVKAACREYCRTKEGREIYAWNCDNFNWGDFVSNIPNEICEKYGIKKLQDDVAMVRDLNEQLVGESEVYGSTIEKGSKEEEDFVIEGIKENVDCKEAGYGKNDRFLQDVLQEYRIRLDNLDANYREKDAREDAIRHVCDSWNEMNLER